MEPAQGHGARAWVAYRAIHEDREMPNVTEAATEADYCDLGHAVSAAMEADGEFGTAVLRKLIEGLPRGKEALR